MKEIIMNSVGIDAIEYQQWLKNLFEEIDRQRLICDSLPKNTRIFHLCKFRLHKSDLLLELGKGFSFIGRQYPLDIAGEEHRVDLMMYHTRLHCYVAIELKVVEFKPEFISKLNFYISAIDDLLKMPEDNPTIGLLLCRSKNDTKVEYALRDITQPLGVASYETRQIIEDIRSSVEAYLASDNIG